MEKTLLRLLPYFLLAAMLAAIGIFLFSRGNDNGAKASYVNGVGELEVDGTKYSMVNDITEEVYVGSKVRSLVSADRGAQMGIVKSMGMFTLAKLFYVLGDSEQKYLIDNNGRLYVKSGAEADALRENLKKEECFPSIRIVTKDHTPGTAQVLSEEETAMLRALPSEGEKITVTDKAFVTDYSNRREVFGFTEDGLLYKVVMELFQYKEEIYLTTEFSGDKNTAKDQSLGGVKLPEEYQNRFRELFGK